VLQPLGMASVGLGDLVKAREYSEEAVTLARDLGDQRELAAAFNALAQLHRVEGELGLAEPLFENAVLITRELGDQEGIAIGLLNLAMVSIGRGSGEQARRMLLEVVTIARQIGSQPVGQSALDVTAGLCATRQQWEEAVRLFTAAEAQAKRSGLQRDAVDEAFVAPLVSIARAALKPAVLDACDDDGSRLPLDDALALARACLVRAE